MKRRDFLFSTGAAVGVSLLARSSTAAAENGQHKVLYFTRSAGFEHSVVRRNGNALSHSERVLTELGRQHNVEVVKGEFDVFDLPHVRARLAQGGVGGLDRAFGHVDS